MLASSSSAAAVAVRSLRSLQRQVTTPIMSRHGRCFISSRTAVLYAELPYHLVVGLPALSPTMHQGTLSEWYVKEGDAFSAGDAIAKIETDKAAMDFEAQDDGVVAKILIKAGEGEDLDVGTPIMVTVEDAKDVAAFANFVAAAAPAVVGNDAGAAAVAPAKAAAPAAAPTLTPPAAAVVAKLAVPAPPPATVKPAPVVVAAAKPAVPPPPPPALPVVSGGLAATSPLAKRLAAQQLAYVEKYGTTSYKPLAV